MLKDDVTTSPGLHFVASVRKKAIECQDASTNTDPGKMLFSCKNLYVSQYLIYVDFLFRTDLQEMLNCVILVSHFNFLSLALVYTLHILNLKSNLQLNL